MSVHTIQVTIGAAATAFSTSRIPIKEAIVQNNSAHTMRVGDKTVTTSIGIQLAANGAVNSLVYFGPYQTLDVSLADLFVAGTQNDVLDVTYTK